MADISLQEFKQRLAETEARCRITGCGYRAHSLVRHLREAHGMSVGKYKETLGAGDSQVLSRVGQELLRRLNRKAPDDLAVLIKQFEFEGTSALQALTRKKVDPTKLDPATLMWVPKLDPLFSFPEELTRAVTYGTENDINVFIQGPTGCGKTAPVTQLHAAMGKPVRRVNMNGGVTPGTFFGRMKADVKVGTSFQEGILPWCMRYGVPLIVDEYDYTPPPIAAALNPVMEEGVRTLYLAETDEEIKAKAGFCIIATANTGGKGDNTGAFTGTQILNTANLDRFGLRLSADYLPEEQEKAMLAHRYPKEDVKAIERLVVLANEVREAFKRGEIAITLSTRKLMDYFLFRPTHGGPKSLDYVLLNWLDPEDRQVIDLIVSKVRPFI